MIIFAIALLLVSCAVLALLLVQVYVSVPLKELKRRAARNEEPAATLFQAAAYGTELRAFLWLVALIALSGSFVLFARLAPSLLGFIVIVLVAWLGFVRLPRIRPGSAMARFAVLCTPVLVRILRFWHPVGRYVSSWAIGGDPEQHTGVFAYDDMFDLLDQQQQQADSDISEIDLDRMRAVLHLNRYHVRDILVASKQVVAVSAQDQVSPVLVDELHKTGHEQFPVYDNKPTNIIGILPLDAIANIKHQGSVRDYYDDHITYVHENDTLEQALRAFYETRHHLFIVVNNADEYMGIATLHDILHCLFGAIEHAQFGRYDDRSAVAARHRQASPAEHHKKDAEKHLEE